MKRLFGLLIIAILLPVTIGNSQTVEQTRSVTVAPAVADLAFGRVPGIATSPAPLAHVYFGQNEDRQAWNDAYNALREADSESAKSDAKNKLEELLTAQYNESLDNYDKYLEELSSKIAEMKKQVEKRRDARDEMVQLKLLMTISEAEGLGWPDNRQGFGLPSLQLRTGGINATGFSNAPGAPFPPGNDPPEGIIDSEEPTPPSPTKSRRPGGVR